MPCWIVRLRRLPLRLRQNLIVPTDPWFERELEKELKVERHEEVEGKVNAMSDEEFVALLERLIQRRRKPRRPEEGEKAEVQYIT